MVNSIKAEFSCGVQSYPSFTVSSDFTSGLPCVSLTSTVHLYLPVHHKILVVQCEHWESFDEDLDDSGKFRKQLEVCLLCSSMKHA